MPFFDKNVVTESTVIFQRLITRTWFFLALAGVLAGCACPHPPRNANNAVVSRRVEVPVWSCDFFCDLAFNEESRRVSCSFLDEPKTKVACEFADNTQEPPVNETRTIDSVWEIRIDHGRDLSWANVQNSFGRPDGCDVCTDTPEMWQWLKAGFSDSQVRINCSISGFQGDTLGTLVRVVSCHYASNCRS